MSDEELQCRKKRLRAAHRASVTRMSTQVTEDIEAPNDLSVQLSKQKREALKEKGDQLKKLDEEIIGFVEEDKLEEEIEGVDQVQEKIELTLMHIEMAQSTEDHPSTSHLHPLEH